MAKKKTRRCLYGMSYQNRQSRYNQEKQELYSKCMDLPPEELDRLRNELIEKWGV